MKFDLPTYHFDSNLREVPDDLDKWKTSAVLLQETMDLTDSSNEYLSLLENLGFVLRVLGRLEEAEIKLKEALELSADHPNPLKLVQNMLRLAHVYQWQERFKEAEKLLAEVKTLMKNSSLADGLKATFHQHYGKLLFDQQKYKLAQEQFAKALEIRESIKAPQDQIASSRLALEQTLKRTESL